MAFSVTSDTVRAKMHLSDKRLAVLLGIAFLAVAVVLSCAFMVFRGFGITALPFFADESTVVRKADEQHAEGETGEGQASNIDGTPLCVYVCGAVACEGVYRLPEGTRVVDAVDAAGGFSEDAQTSAVNLARLLEDGEQIVIPTEEEYASEDASGRAATGQSRSGVSAEGKVNINKAGLDELESLSGIGPSTAQKIIADREANGPFSSIEEIRRVSGIGEKKFAAIADAICVE